MMFTDGLLQPYCAKFESVESTFSFARYIRQGIVEAPRRWLKMAMQIQGHVEPEWVEKEMGVVMDTREGHAYQTCIFMSADNYWVCVTQRSTWSR